MFEFQIDHRNDNGKGAENKVQQNGRTCFQLQWNKIKQLIDFGISLGRTVFSVPLSLLFHSTCCLFSLLSSSQYEYEALAVYSHTQSDGRYASDFSFYLNFILSALKYSFFSAFFCRLFSSRTHFYFFCFYGMHWIPSFFRWTTVLAQRQQFFLFLCWLFAFLFIFLVRVYFFSSRIFVEYHMKRRNPSKRA